jgi:polyisoprenoid-binding protein YceI
MTVHSHIDVSTTDPTEFLSNGAWVGDWTLDPNGSEMRIRSTSVWGLLKVTGEFPVIRGSGSLREDGVAIGTFAVTTASIDTGNKMRDRHLRSHEFLRAATHPEITYALAEITQQGPGQVRLSGELTVVDRTRPLELTATVEESNATCVTLSTEVVLDRSHWGVDYNRFGMIGTTTRVEARLRFIRPS